MADLMMEVPLADGHSVVVEVDRREVPGELVLATSKPGVIIAKGTADVHFVVKLTWRK